MNKNRFKFLGIIAFVAIIGFTLFSCDSPAGGDGNGDGDGGRGNNGNSQITGGTLIVHNGTQNNSTVTIFFNNTEVFSGSLGSGQTIRRSSNIDTEWQVSWRIFHNGSRIGILSGGKTVIYHLGD